MTEFMLMKNALDKVYQALDPVEQADEEKRMAEDMEEADRKDHERRERECE